MINYPTESVQAADPDTAAIARELRDGFDVALRHLSSSSEVVSPYCICETPYRTRGCNQGGQAEPGRIHRGMAIGA